MNKKLLIGLMTAIILVFSSSLCFANDALNDAAHGAQNVVGGAENAIKDTVNGAANMTKDMTNKAENGMNNVTENMKDNGDNNTTRKDTNNETSTNDDNYTAVRTSTEGSTTFMGMNATTWTWLIIGIATIAIIALVWYYSAQFANSNYKDRD